MTLPSIRTFFCLLCVCLFVFLGGGGWGWGDFVFNNLHSSDYVIHVLPIKICRHKEKYLYCSVPSTKPYASKYSSFDFSIFVQRRVNRIKRNLL